MGNQQTCCFRKLLQWCHGPCCVPFRRMVNEGCDCFCCRWWYVQGIVSDDWLRSCGCFTWSCFNCHCQMWEMDKVCVVSMTALLFLIKCNPVIGPVNFFNTTKCSANVLSPISNLGVVVANAFSNWPLATCIWKLGGLLILRLLFGAFSFFLFYCVPVLLGDGTDKCSRVHQCIYR